MAALFVFEGTAEHGDRYVKALEQYGLPHPFVANQARHNEINVSESHGDITVELLAQISFVSADDAERASRNVSRTIDLVYELHADVQRYYSDPVWGIPRVFPRGVRTESDPGTSLSAGTQRLLRARVPRALGEGAQCGAPGAALETVADWLYDEVKTSLALAIRGLGPIEDEEHFSKAFIKLDSHAASPCSIERSAAAQSISDLLVVLAAANPTVYERALGVLFGEIVPVPEDRGGFAGPHSSAEVLISAVADCRLGGRRAAHASIRPSAIHHALTMMAALVEFGSAMWDDALRRTGAVASGA